MPKQWMRSVLLIITYTVLLVLGLMRSDWIFGLLGQILAGCRPLFIGFAIAFILNRPCAFFCRHYERNLGKRWRKLGRPLAVLTSYLALIAVIVALFSFVLPQVVESIRMLAGSLGGYIANLQTLLNQAADYLDWEAVDLDLSSLNQYLREFLNGVLTSVSNAATQVVNHLHVCDPGAGGGIFHLYAGRKGEAAQPGPPAAAGLSAGAVGRPGERCDPAHRRHLLQLCLRPAHRGLHPGRAVRPGHSVHSAGLRRPHRGHHRGVRPDPGGGGTSIGLPGIWVLAAVTVGGGLFGLLGVLLSVPVASVVYALIKRDVRRRLTEKGENPAETEDVSPEEEKE